MNQILTPHYDYENVVSEQGRDGVLWTLFETIPFASRRIATFSTEADARYFIELCKTHRLLTSTQSDGDAVEMLSFICFAIEWEEGALDDNERISWLYNKWVKDFLPSLNEPHFGDCTNAPIACIRCQTEMWIKQAKAILALKRPTPTTKGEEL